MAIKKSVNIRPQQLKFTGIIKPDFLRQHHLNFVDADPGAISPMVSTRLEQIPFQQ